MTLLPAPTADDECTHRAGIGEEPCHHVADVVEGPADRFDDGTPMLSAGP